MLLTAQKESMSCKVMLLIGTSAVVYPAASLPYLAKQNGAQIIEINLEESFPEADYYIQEKAGIVLPGIVDETRSIIDTR